MRLARRRRIAEDDSSSGLSGSSAMALSTKDHNGIKPSHDRSRRAFRTLAKKRPLFAALGIMTMVAAFLPFFLSNDLSPSGGVGAGLDSFLSYSQPRNLSDSYREIRKNSQRVQSRGWTRWLFAFARLSGGSSSPAFPSEVLLDNAIVRNPLSSFQKGLPPLTRPVFDEEYQLDMESILIVDSLLFVPEESFYRQVQADDDDIYEKDREALLDEIDYHLKERFYHYEDLDYPRDCVRPQWSYDNRQACNAFHEYLIERVPTEHSRDLVDYTVDYIAHGHYRDTWIMGEPRTKDAQDFVLKRLRIQREFDRTCYEARFFKTHSEALVLERLTGSPVHSAIYGYCGTSVAVQRANEVTFDIVPELPMQEERGRLWQKELDELEAASPEGVVSLNNWTIPQKLTMMIQIAQGMAELHNHPGGVIVHDDVHPDQWLITDQGTLILNDVNNAHVLDYNPKKGEYCKFWTSYGGDFQSPEEFEGAYVDEKSDLWPVGLMVFTLLTGLWPYYRQRNDETIQKTTIRGIPPVFNPKFRTRSLIEGRLVDLMERCLKKNPEERLDMTQILEHLYETQRLYNIQQAKTTHDTTAKILEDRQETQRHHHVQQEANATHGMTQILEHLRKKQRLHNVQQANATLADPS